MTQITNKERLENARKKIENGIDLGWWSALTSKNLLHTVHLAECWEKLKKNLRSNPNTAEMTLDILTKMDLIENPTPKDPLEELEEWIDKYLEPTLASSVPHIKAKIKEIRGRK
jgi:hypothetical protein